MLKLTSCPPQIPTLRFLFSTAKSTQSNKYLQSRANAPYTCVTKIPFTDASKYSDTVGEIVRLETVVANNLHGRVSDLKAYRGDTGEFLSNLP